MSDPASQWTRDRLDALGHAIANAERNDPLRNDESDTVFAAVRDFHKLMTSKP